MCGIVGYIGHRDAYPIIIKGLQRLEYRGYDSAGVVLFDGENMRLAKTKGKVEDLKNKAETNIPTNGKLGLGHTRWATHGIPNDQRPAAARPFRLSGRRELHSEGRSCREQLLAR